MNEHTQRYCYSWDDRDFKSGGFSSINDALSDALSNRIDRDPPQSFVYIAKAKEYDNRTFFPDSELIIEHMECIADDLGGEYANNYPDVDKAAKDELTQRLHEVLDQWCAKHEVSPTFYGVGKGVKYDLETFEPVQPEQ